MRLSFFFILYFFSLSLFLVVVSLFAIVMTKIYFDIAIKVSERKKFLLNIYDYWLRS